MNIHIYGEIIPMLKLNLVVLDRKGMRGIILRLVGLLKCSSKTFSSPSGQNSMAWIGSCGHPVEWASLHRKNHIFTLGSGVFILCSSWNFQNRPLPPSQVTSCFTFVSFLCFAACCFLYSGSKTCNILPSSKVLEMNKWYF